MILRVLDEYRKAYAIAATCKSEFAKLLSTQYERRMRLSLARLGVRPSDPLAIEKSVLIAYGLDLVQQLAGADEYRLGELKAAYELPREVSSAKCSELEASKMDAVIAAARLEHLKSKGAYCRLTSEECVEINRLYDMLEKRELLPHARHILQQALAARNSELLYAYSETPTNDRSLAIEALWEVGFYRTDFITGVPGQHERDLMLVNPDWREMATSQKWLEIATDTVKAKDTYGTPMYPISERDMEVLGRNPDWIEILSNPTILSMAYTI